MNTSSPTKDDQELKCGIIMPIAGTSIEYSNSHWSDVLSIIKDSVNTTRYIPDLVSNDTAVGLIHERIVKNIYENEIVVCDVSSKNPNVMFELGMRLAFDKPTIVIKDEKTDYSFDTSPIEHLSYPHSLRYGDIEKFKLDLARRINDTVERSKNDKDFSPFLKSFGRTIKSTPIPNTEVSQNDYIIETMEFISKEILELRREQKNSIQRSLGIPMVGANHGLNEIPFEVVLKYLSNNHGLIMDRAISDIDLLETLRVNLAKTGTFLQDYLLLRYVDNYRAMNGFGISK